MLQGLLMSRDELLRRRLQSILFRMGFSEILTAESSRETQTRLQRLQLGLRFVLLDADGWQGDETEWAEVIAAIEEPIRCLQVPLVVIGTLSQAEVRSKIRPMGQLQYCYFKKPFTADELLFGIEKASQKLLFYSQPLIYCGTEVPGGLRKELSLFRTSFHPRFEFAATGADLRAEISALRGGPAVVLIDPETFASEDDIRWLRRFKMTPAGRRCRLICLSRAPETIVALRRVAEMFWEPKGSWLGFVERIAASTGQSLFCDILAEQAKKQILDDRSRLARTKILAGLRVDPFSLRLRSLGAEIALFQGKRRMAMKEFQAMLLLNPCLPQGYLGLWNCVESGERPGLIQNALKYCPSHPEILSRSS